MMIARIPRWVPTVAVAVAIALLTLLPSDKVPSLPDFDMADKMAHALMFGALSVVGIYDSQRYSHRLSIWLALGVCVLSSLYGGLIEVFQWLLNVGRLGDWADFAADSVGAFLAPAILWMAIGWATRRSGVWLVARSRLPRKAQRLYFYSFPPDERRDVKEIDRLVADVSSPMHAELIYFKGRLSGFITWWEFDRFRYIEHFAIEPSKRGEGIGAKALKAFVGQTDSPVVLEVELPDTSDMARRRIRFYERNGFNALMGYDYIQPPYGPGLQSVPMMLMATVGSGQLTPELIASTLHTRVYETFA